MLPAGLISSVVFHSIVPIILSLIALIIGMYRARNQLGVYWAHVDAAQESSPEAATVTFRQSLEKKG
jgi:hypothetical protein